MSGVSLWAVARPRALLAVACLVCLTSLASLASIGAPPSRADDDDAEEGASAPNGSSRPDAVRGQLIVVFSSTSTDNQRTRAVERSGGTIQEWIRSVDGAVVSVDPNGTDAAARKLAREPAVRFVEPNYVWRATRVPNDQFFDREWGLRNVGQQGGTPGADVNATDAWDVTTGANVTVAVTDTGVDYRHSDLAPNIWTNPVDPPNGVDDDANGYVDDSRGWNLVDDNSDPNDDAGHGTHVAGTIGARGDNGIGVAGVGWDVKIMPLKFLDANGEGSTGAVANAIEYAVSHGARVINASWGGPSFSQALYLAVQHAGALGALFVAAAGNDGRNIDVSPEYPAAFKLPNVITVAATDREDKLADFSNYGSSSVSLAAPGEDIYSTVPTRSGRDRYAYYSGTSMAAPFVSGAAALYLSKYPQAGVEHLRGAILQSVDSLPTLAGKVATGGRLDVAKMLSAPGPAAPKPAPEPASAVSASGPTPFKLVRPRYALLTRKRSLRFVWQRSRATTGISKYKLFINGRAVKTIAARRGRDPRPYTRIRVRSGKRRWFVRAYDRAGHSRTSRSFRRGRYRKTSVLFVGPRKKKRPVANRR
jgi:thermitase